MSAHQHPLSSHVSCSLTAFTGSSTATGPLPLRKSASLEDWGGWCATAGQQNRSQPSHMQLLRHTCGCSNMAHAPLRRVANGIFGGGRTSGQLDPSNGTEQLVITAADGPIALVWHCVVWPGRCSEPSS
ncbi:hypothetical protein M441DRAFT_290108 [Trichoderma asperellum CBS 433.97]|uniref:Uncharacterized protein n=1 Tax=Trichoderma asperellum (strain ATCC 204424 / CBS 433.97 / NBRC 101777) TaxID=1042311 RepID=A0A2T3YTY0_TRIA4|nr:hypothetical protein M441DRAFT_290108 [Trichoderma asperellum CBS 433.97]PTB35997.1 hypothetical protein M441DRAFT_290108 [Trichoderma asperellum CBS 433.97]